MITRNTHECRAQITHSDGAALAQFFLSVPSLVTHSSPSPVFNCHSREQEAYLSQLVAVNQRTANLSLVSKDLHHCCTIVFIHAAAYCAFVFHINTKH